MDELWLAAPASAIKVWRADGGAAAWRANAALKRLCLEQDDAWTELADTVLRLCEATLQREGAAVPRLSIGTQWYRATPLAMPPGDDGHGGTRWLVWLEAEGELNVELSSLVSLAGVAVWRIDATTQRIQLNDRGYRVLGLQPVPDGVPLELFRETVHPDDMQDVIDAAQRALACDRVIDLVTRYRSEDGGYRHWLTRRVAQRDAQGQAVAIVGVSLDQTERIAERSKAQSLADSLEFITQSTGVGVWRYDMARDLFEWDAQVHRIYGTPPDQPPPTGRHYLDHIVHPEDRQRVQAAARAAIDSGQVVPMEVRARRPDGSERWLSSWLRFECHDGVQIGFGVTMDATDRRLAESRLRDAIERALLATEAAGIGAWERDFVADTSLWDAQMHRLRGLPPRAGLVSAELRLAARHPDDKQALDERLRAAFEAGRNFDGEFRVQWPDGSVHWLATRAIVQRAADGTPRGMLGVNWDITERKRVEEALRDKAAAEQASRAKSAFLSRMSHELRTPLNAVLGFAQLMQHDRDDAPSARQAERLGFIESAGLHLLALIDDVLDLSTIEAAPLRIVTQAVPLQVALDDALQWTRAQAECAGLRLDIEPLAGSVLADARRLRQIFANLLSNAIKYNRADGAVGVSAQGLRRGGIDGWQVSVHDTGRGLDAGQRAQLFEPFNRLGAEREGIAGTGIGLAIVQHLLAQMRGHIEVDSEPGAGSVFRVWLPAALESDAGTAVSSLPLHAPVGEPRPLHVLCIEDNPINLLLVEELVALRRHVRLRTATTGAEGVAMALSETPDVVLVDMQLPDFDGFEVLRRLAVQHAGRMPQIVALSANAAPEDIRRAAAAGFDQYWTKPIDFAQFLGGLDALSTRGG